MKEELKQIKFSIRSIFIFEQLMDKIFELKTTSDFYAYYYACLLAGKEYNKTFDEFIEDCDENTECLVWFLGELDKNNKMSNQFNKNDDNLSKKKSKSKK